MPQAPSEIEIFTLNSNREENAFLNCSRQSSSYDVALPIKEYPTTSSESIPFSAFIASTVNLISTMLQDTTGLVDAIDSGKTPPFDGPQNHSRWSEPSLDQQLVLTCAVLAPKDSEDCIGIDRTNVEKNHLSEIEQWSPRSDGVITYSDGVGVASSLFTIGNFEAENFPPKEPSFEFETIVDTISSTSTEITSEDENDFEDPDSVYELFDDVSVLTSDSSMEGIPIDNEDTQEAVNFSPACADFQDCPDSSTQETTSERSISVSGEAASCKSPIDTPIEALQINSIAGESPIPDVVHATDDLRLMSFLLDFCSEASSRNLSEL